jgi:hypothetical protein
MQRLHMHSPLALTPVLGGGARSPTRGPLTPCTGRSPGVSVCQLQILRNLLLRKARAGKIVHVCSLEGWVIL